MGPIFISGQAKMGSESLFLVVMSVIVVSAIFVAAVSIIHINGAIRIAKFESRFRELEEQLDHEYANGGLRREKISAEGKTIEVWHLVKSDKAILIEVELQFILAEVQKINSRRAGELAMSLMMRRGR